MRKRFGIGALAVAAMAVTTAVAIAAVPGYKGQEGSAPAAFPKPKKVAGSCTIGYMNPLAANESLQYMQKGAVAQAKALGCKLILLDDALNVDKQVSNMQQLLAQKVNAIVFYPLDPKATTPVLAQAKKAGVPVVAIDSNFGNPKKAPVAPGIVAQVWQGRDIQAFLQVQALAKAKPGAKVGLIGIGAPVPALKYLNSREAAYAKAAGLTVLGTQDNATDDVTGGEKAGNALIQRYQDLDAVIAYNDPSAVGAVIAARSAGKKLTVIGLNGTSDGIAAVKDGRLAATVQGDAPGIGRETVKAAYIWATKQQKGVPTIVVLPPRIVTKANVGSLPSWDAEVAAIK